MIIFYAFSQSVQIIWEITKVAFTIFGLFYLHDSHVEQFKNSIQTEERMSSAKDW